MRWTYLKKVESDYLIFDRISLYDEPEEEAHRAPCPEFRAEAVRLLQTCGRPLSEIVDKLAAAEILQRALDAARG